MSIFIKKSPKIAIFWPKNPENFGSAGQFSRDRSCNFRVELLATPMSNLHEYLREYEGGPRASRGRARGHTKNGIFWLKNHHF